MADTATIQVKIADAPAVTEILRRAADRLGSTDALLREGLHLCMYGERAPGGDETWGEWARKVEEYLREVEPPEAKR